MVYLFEPDGNVVHCVRLICADEEAAKQRAQQLAETNRVELWRLTRKLARSRAIRHARTEALGLRNPRSYPLPWRLSLTHTIPVSRRRRFRSSW